MIKRLRPIMLLLAAASAGVAGAFNASYYSSGSRMASGHWVKVKVNGQGIHQITYDQLRECGFSDPKKVRVFGYGGTLLTDNLFRETTPDDVQPTRTLHTADGRVLFYGEGDRRFELVNDCVPRRRRNVYSTGGYYFLSDVEAPADSESLPVTGEIEGALPAVDTHLNTTVIEIEAQNPARGGAIFHETPMKAGEARSYTFGVKDFASDDDTTPAVFGYSFAARSQTNTTLELTYPENVNVVSQRTGTADLFYLDSRYYASASGNVQFIADADHQVADGELTFSLRLPLSSGATYAAVDYTGLTYCRRNRLGDNGQLLMHFNEANSGQDLLISEAAEGSEVWDVTDPSDVKRHSTAYDKATSTVRASFSTGYTYGSTGRFVAFDPSAVHPSAEIVGEVANQDLHALDVPDMLVICTASLEDKARELAELHAIHQGMDVAVVTQDKVFNEFSSGTPSAMGYRRMAKMFRDRNPHKFKYLLLYGTGSYDNRHITVPDRDHLLTYQAEGEEEARDHSTNYCGDSYFGMLNDYFNPSRVYFELCDIAVGRITAGDVNEAAAYNNKVRRHLESRPGSDHYTRAVMLSDDGDRHIHYDQSEAAIAALREGNPAFVVTKAHNLVYPWENGDAVQARAVIVDALSQGQGYFSYSGHGEPNSFTAQMLWSKNMANETEYMNAPVGMLATCDAFSYDRLDNGISHTMLMKEYGGLIGVVAASRTVYLDHNQVLNLAFAKAYSRASEGATLGDIYLQARNNVVRTTSSKECAVNTMCYNLGGDPALPLSAPSLTATLTEVGGVSVDSTEPVAINPLVPVSFSGKVTDSYGQVDQSFNGTVRIELYDGAVDAYTEVKDPRDKAYDSQSKKCVIDNKVLAQACAEVKDGLFEVTVIAPEAMKPGSVNRVVITASADDNSRYASGLCENVSVSPYNRDLASGIDTSAPEIVEMYIDDPAFVNGDEVGDSFTLYATLDPSATGINMAAGTLGSGARMIVDGNKSYPQVRGVISLPGEDGYSRIEMPMAGLTPGRHTLMLSVANNAGERAERTISFTVLPGGSAATLSVDAATARTEAVFELEHSMEGDPEATLVVRDATGRTVLTRRNVAFPYVWDLRDSGGTEVADGRYTAYATLRSGTSRAATGRAEVVVMK